MNITDDLQELKADMAALKEDMNNFWLIFGAILVFWMQAGFAMLEVGTVAKKNTKNILVKNIFDASIGALCWWATGYTLAYGPGDNFPKTGENGFAGTQAFFYDYQADIDKTALHFDGKAEWFFQWAFAGAAVTIVSGCVAERCSFVAYLIYAVALTAVVYPCVVHMNWSGAGYLSPWRENRLLGGCGFIDFAGSGTVHLTGGVAALVAAICVGPRTGRFSDEWVMPEASPVLQTLGVFILWTGWYAFNGVSTLAIVNGYSGIAAHVCMTTTIAAASACLATTLIGYLHLHIIDPGLVNNGILAGLVAITSACATVSVWGAFIIGIIAAPTYYFSSIALKKLHVDDVVDAIPVHGACGVLGAIVPSLFSTPFFYATAYYSDRKDRCAGVFYGGNPAGSLKAAFLGVGIIIAWVGSSMFLVLGTIRLLGQHRVPISVELEGMDVSKHGGALLSMASPVKRAVDNKTHPVPVPENEPRIAEETP